MNRPNQIALTRDVVLQLMRAGLDDQFRNFTRDIAAQPQKVKDFATFFDDIIEKDDFDWNGTSNEIMAVLDIVSESIDAMDEFMHDFPEDRHGGAFLDFINHGHEATITVGWVDRRYGRFVWERWERPLEDPVLAYAELTFLADECDYAVASKPATSLIPPLYRYHPERFKAFHTCADEVGKLYRHHVDPRNGMLSLDLLNILMGYVVGELNQKGRLYPRRLTLEAPSPSLVIEANESLVTTYGRFIQAGRQIIDFPPTLTDLLSNTDVDDIPLNTIKLPYAAQYLHFGPRPELEMEPGWVADGCYVEARGEAGDIRFTVTAVPDDPDKARDWFINPEPNYTQDFVEQFRYMDLATAMDTVFSDRMHGLVKAKDKPGGLITDDVRDTFDQRGEQMPEGIEIVDVSPKMADTRIEMEQRRHPVYRAMLRLVVNALCYITAYPDDIATVWPEGTPQSLRNKADVGKGKEVLRARSKLAALGYVPIHICGQRLAEQMSNLPPGPGSGRHHATHWRRGHWRNQPHGEGRALRKLIWLMPVLVGHTQNDEPDAGHLYLVS